MKFSRILAVAAAVLMTSAVASQVTPQPRDQSGPRLHRATTAEAPAPAAPTTAEPVAGAPVHADNRRNRRRCRAAGPGPDRPGRRRQSRGRQDQGRRLRRLPRHSTATPPIRSTRSSPASTSVHRSPAAPVQERRAREPDHAGHGRAAERAGHARHRRLLRHPDGAAGRRRRRHRHRQRPECRPEVLPGRRAAVPRRRRPAPASRPAWPAMVRPAAATRARPIPRSAASTRATPSARLQFFRDGGVWGNDTNANVVMSRGREKPQR